MSDDEQQFGLDVPNHTGLRGRGLLAGAMYSPPPNTIANHLDLYDDEGNSRHGQELLEQMLVEMQQMVIPPNGKPTATSMAAEIGISMAREVEELATKENLEPDSIGHKMMLLGYIYGKLTMPRRSEHRKLLRHAIADLRRQAGPLSVQFEQERGRQWIEEKAMEIWRQDHDQELRISKVASLIRDDVLVEMKRCQEEGNDGPRKHWPKSLDKIKDTIRALAPDYAKKPGRPPRK